MFVVRSDPSTGHSVLLLHHSRLLPSHLWGITASIFAAWDSVSGRLGTWPQLESRQRPRVLTRRPSRGREVPGKRMQCNAEANKAPVAQAIRIREQLELTDLCTYA